MYVAIWLRRVIWRSTSCLVLLCINCLAGPAAGVLCGQLQTARLQLHGCRPTATASTSTCRTAGGWRGTVATTNAIAVPPWQGKARSSLSLSSVVQ